MAAVGLYTNSVNKQITIQGNATKEFNALLIGETDKKIDAMKELNALQIRETDKKIDAMKELAAIQVNSIEKSTKESIKASEARIDSILLKFVVENKHIANEKK